MEISNNLNNFDNAANTIINKVKTEINKWYRFGLSLPGRIAVTKSLVYSQLNYLGSFLPFTGEQLKKMAEPIENFISGNLNIAKARIYAKIENVGLGLVEIKNFLNYQKCGWIKLALKPDENWKQLIFLKSCGDIGNLREKWVLDHPILKGFGRTLDFLRRAFSLDCENFRKANIYDSPTFPVTRRPLRTIDANFLAGGPQHFDAVSKLSIIIFDDFWTGTRGRELADINQITGIQFTQEQADIIVGICRDAVTRYSKECPTEKSSSTLEDFIKQYRKGSKIFKHLLTKEKHEFIPHNIKKYAKNTDCVINLNQSRLLALINTASYGTLNGHK